MKKDCYTLPKIALVACGGTIGGEWSPVRDTVVPSKTGNKWLSVFIHQQARPHKKIEFIDLFNKDSRDVTDKDRERIYRAIKKLRAKGLRHFLVTHGTFTLTDTGAYLDRRFRQQKVNDVFVVLCGSVVGLHERDIREAPGYCEKRQKGAV